MAKSNILKIDGRIRPGIAGKEVKFTSGGQFESNLYRDWGKEVSQARRTAHLLNPSRDRGRKQSPEWESCLLKSAVWSVNDRKWKRCVNYG